MITSTYNTQLTGRLAIITFVITDTIGGTVSGSVQWGDGSSPVSISGGHSDSSVPFAFTLSHEYSSDGFYLVQLDIVNRRAPVPDTGKVTVPLEVFTKTVTNNIANLPGFLIGPILPLDKSSPTVDQWCFHVGKDTQVLESNIRLILLTAFGERLMNPEFGTGLRRMIFEKDIRLTETVIREEIVAAVSRYEPRVTIDTVAVVKHTDRDAHVNAVFSPKDDVGSAIPMSIGLSR